ncbi:hypothetical protein OSTOST_14030, partial [Ostertagia ostertagi]
NAKRASVAAAPLAAWVTANLQYSEILEKISPLEQEKNQLVSNLSKAEKQIEKLSKGLLTVDEKVAALKEKFEGLMMEATQIKIDLEKEQLNWKNHGLPGDSLSVENTVVMFNNTQTPLVIDPTGRIAAFLHSFIDKSELLRAAQNDLFTQIEFGIRFGKTIIVDDVAEIDAALVPIFRRELSSQGPRQV